MPQPVERREVSPAALQGYVRTFINRRDMYPLQLRQGSYITRREPLSDALLYAHLNGRLTLGTYALDADSRAKFLVFDADEEASFGGLVTLQQALAADGVSAYSEQSRRGGHLWLFFAPLPGADARRLGWGLLLNYGLTETKLEIFPKQDRLRGGPGSLVRLPLGKHRLTGEVYPFVDEKGEPLAPSLLPMLALLAQPQLVLPETITAILRLGPPAPQLPVQATGRGEPPGERLSETIKARVSLTAVVAEYVELDANGKANCPFHDDQVKSFAVHPNGVFWKCFAGCGQGDVINFQQLLRERAGEDASFKATLAELAARYLD